MSTRNPRRPDAPPSRLPLSEPEWQLMWVIWQLTPPILPTRILFAADRTHDSPAASAETLHAYLDQLVRKGWLERLPAADLVPERFAPRVAKREAVQSRIQAFLDADLHNDYPSLLAARTEIDSRLDLASEVAEGRVASGDGVG
ncbi:MAG: BlaI/MecI/CopY family transcriptional regulator [Myxococcales bacterium]|nr:BlaI/MecI/CopY family transcriptional regulator [Myxococcales bacterium]